MSKNEEMPNSPNATEGKMWYYGEEFGVLYRGHLKGPFTWDEAMEYVTDICRDVKNPEFAFLVIEHPE